MNSNSIWRKFHRKRCLTLWLATRTENQMTLTRITSWRLRHILALIEGSPLELKMLEAARSLKNSRAEQTLWAFRALVCPVPTMNLLFLRGDRQITMHYYWIELMNQVYRAPYNHLRINQPKGKTAFNHNATKATPPVSSPQDVNQSRRKGYCSSRTILDKIITLRPHLPLEHIKMNNWKIRQSAC